MARVLIVDDEPRISGTLSLVLRARNYEVDVATSGEQALAIVKAQPPDLALLDIRLPGMNGLELFLALRAYDPQFCAVFMTASGNVRTAVDAMRAGAFDYVTKPFDNDELVLTIERALELRRLKGEITTLRDELHGRVAVPDIVGSSPSIQNVLRDMAKIARTPVDVLVLGESGTGKELVARGLHRMSRPNGPFVAVNCSAIPQGLVESEFFGHERGAFTDAKEHRVGRFQQADGGTLFLDEIGDLPLDAQAKLLRVVQDREVTPVGSKRPIKVDIRIVSATNRDLTAAIEARSFRGDLYFRLKVVALSLPPLRDRREDLPLLTDHMIRVLSAELGARCDGIAEDAATILRTYDWPGNIRELQNVLKQAIVFGDGPVIQARDLPALVAGGVRHSEPSPALPAGLTLADAVNRAGARVERTLIETALAERSGNRTATANALGINRKTLFLKMRMHGLVAREQEEDVD